VPPGTAQSWSVTNNDAHAVRAAWLKRYAPAGQSEHAWQTYRAMYEHGPAVEAESTWRAVMEHMPTDLLRTHIANMASSADAFIALRATFLRTLAVFNVACYVIGLGDRHLDNYLLDGDSGAVVPIDFGAAFGAASSSLPVPELLPFRLTPTLLGVAAPLPARPLLHTHMTAALRALRDEAAASTLLTVMSVFVREPTLDWQQLARRRAHTATEGGSAAAGGAGAASGRSRPASPARAAAGGRVTREGTPEPGAGAADGSGDREVEAAVASGAWYPLAKLLQARLKLSGANPCGLLMVDLLQNAFYVLNRAQKASYEKAVRGIRGAVYGPTDRGEPTRDARQQWTAAAGVA
jgi:hypothetical protein